MIISTGSSTNFYWLRVEAMMPEKVGILMGYGNTNITSTGSTGYRDIYKRL